MLHEAARPGSVQSFWIMADLVLHRLRAMRRRLHELRRELDVAIREAARLADEQPDGPEFVEALEVVESVGARLAATRRLAASLNRMLPTPDVRLVPPPPERWPAPRPPRGRSFAKRVIMPAYRQQTPVD